MKQIAAYQTKLFKKWNKKSKIPYGKLLVAVKSIDGGSGIVDLGGSLYKVRISKDKGKSGGYRTIIMYKKGFRSLFMYGFEKNELDNISDKELKRAKQYVKIFLNLSEDRVKNLLDSNSIYPLEEQ